MFEIYEFLVKYWNKILLIIAGLLVTIVIVTIMIPREQYPQTNGPKYQSEDDLRLGAFTAATMFMQKGLKSPATAEFPTFRDNMVWKESHNTYSVKSYVDSQNSFGAMIRTDFYFLLKDSVDTWFVVEYKVNGR